MRYINPRTLLFLLFTRTRRLKRDIKRRGGGVRAPTFYASYSLILDVFIRQRECSYFVNRLFLLWQGNVRVTNKIMSVLSASMCVHIKARKKRRNAEHYCHMGPCTVYAVDLLFVFLIQPRGKTNPRHIHGPTCIRRHDLWFHVTMCGSRKMRKIHIRGVETGLIMLISLCF